MRLRLLTSLVLLFSFALSACGPRVGGLTTTGPRYSASSNAVDDYRLGPGDKVKVTVFNEPTLSGEFSVSSEGKLSLPLVGDIHAAGLLVSEVARQNEVLLGNGYLRSPKVNAEVATFRPFFILGEVKLPGQYPYVPNMTIFGAIATAQGFTPRAARKVAYIRRADSQQEEAFSLSADLRVSPGDTIRIGERYF